MKGGGGHYPSGRWLALGCEGGHPHWTPHHKYAGKGGGKRDHQTVCVAWGWVGVHRAVCGMLQASAAGGGGWVGGGRGGGGVATPQAAGFGCHGRHPHRVASSGTLHADGFASDRIFV